MLLAKRKRDNSEAIENQRLSLGQALKVDELSQNLLQYCLEYFQQVPNFYMFQLR